MSTLNYRENIADQSNSAYIHLVLGILEKQVSWIVPGSKYEDGGQKHGEHYDAEVRFSSFSWISLVCESSVDEHSELFSMAKEVITGLAMRVTTIMTPPSTTGLVRSEFRNYQNQLLKKFLR